MKRRQDKRLKELDVHLNSETLNEKREREREKKGATERERRKSLIDFRFTLLFLLIGIRFMRPSHTFYTQLE